MLSNGHPPSWALQFFGRLLERDPIWVETMDGAGLLKHVQVCTFEILSQFLEQECYPGHVQWYGDNPHLIMVDGVKTNVMDEMKSLYRWWHTVWQKERPEVDEILWAEVEKHPSTSLFTPIEGTTLSKFDRQFETEGDEAIHHTCMTALNKLDDIMEEALNKRLHRLVNVIPYMWT